MNVLVGTSGYQYKAWKGTFYPDDMSTAGMLSYYGGVFLIRLKHRMSAAKT